MSDQHAPELALLADIHEAAEPALWPPALGWWLLAVIGIVGLVAGAITLLIATTWQILIVLRTPTYYLYAGD